MKDSEILEIVGIFLGQREDSVPLPVSDVVVFGVNPRDVHLVSELPGFVSVVDYGHLEPLGNEIGCCGNFRFVVDIMAGVCTDISLSGSSLRCIESEKALQS